MSDSIHRSAQGSVHGRVAVVTGGAAGIGQAFAQRLARDGFDVAVADLSAADNTLRLIKEEGRRGYAGECDVSSSDSVRRFADGVLADLGRVDVLVNNAGIYPATAFLDMDWQEWRRVLDVNLHSVFHFGKAFLPGMVERGWGRVVSVSSTTFHSGIPNNTHYTASKGAVIGFTRSLAAEVGRYGVTVNSIAPGLVRTGTTETGPQAALFDLLAQQQAIPRTEEPSDLVGALSFLASDDAGFITGQTLCVDGGWVRS
ncbi:NAD(P)-dependent dehydrogenase (short-subunit alcohol dehydrogenase family) [Streptomyces sp. SAI-133]|uniref:SDR family NAD(P)-dependent oxidoreductase n=1 Tax=unclassified Streptomyces TaxID=2593676 RepID=UPI0024753D71|nr:3-oxoacyl-ACP reductase family protein [Streptomyces sp. SAI-133]MDH6590023.1 NAD(P)-dependent dehydrogenase (short-subunit alcohol dehydrogenase family) [Streptomyces sp. SAI-133]